MGGPDNLLLGLSDGAALPVVLLVAVLLGVRHALDPDHLAAVTTFVAGTEERGLRICARFGFAWGLGHGLTLLALGTPLILFGAALPGWVERAAEALIGVVIVVLALRLLRRWHAGAFHVHEHTHEGDVRHVHLHSHAPCVRHHHPHAQAGRSTLGVLGIGLAHGAGGSTGVGVLLVASMDSRPLAVAALALLAAGTAATMTALSGGLGLTLFRGRTTLLPAPLGAVSLTFGAWYLLAALSVLPYG